MKYGPFFCRFSALRFRKKLLICFTAMALLLTVFFSLAFWTVSSRTVSDIGTRLSQGNAENACGQIGSYFDLIRQNSVQFLRLGSLRQILKAADAGVVSPAEQAALAQDIRSMMDYSSSAAGIEYTMVNVYCKNGFRYTSNAGVQLPFSSFEQCLDWYRSAGYLTQDLAEETWGHLIDTPTVSRQHRFSFVCLRPLYSPSTYQLEGILLAAVSEPSIRAIYAKYYPDAMIIQRDGLVVSAGDSALLNENLSEQPGVRDVLASAASSGTIRYLQDGTERILSFQTIAHGSAYAIVPFQYYHGLDKAELQSIAVSAALIVLTAVVVAALVSWWLSDSLSRSVRAVTDTVHQVEQGELDARCQASQADEIAYIGSRINSMLDQLALQHRREQSYIRAQQGLKLQLLQSQFNPHLLYNCLNSALWALQRQDVPAAQEILLGVSRFFKRSLSPVSDIITLSDELALMQSYLELQHAARGKTFTLETDLSEDLLGVRIPKFTLQPMIENSVLHGFTGFRDDGQITLRGAKDGPRVQLCMQDNGIGIEPELLATLNARLQSGEMPPDGSSFGICNVNLRLRNCFGGCSGIELESEVGEYTLVRITLDLDARKEEHTCTV